METNSEINPPVTPQMDSNAEYISVKGVHNLPPNAYVRLFFQIAATIVTTLFFAFAAAQ